MTTTQDEASIVTIDALAYLEVSKLHWKPLTKFAATPKELEALRSRMAVDSNLTMVHYRDGDLTATNGHAVLRVETNRPDEAMRAGRFLIDPKVSPISAGVISHSHTKEDPEAGLPKLIPQFDAVAQDPHKVIATFDARLLKLFCETAIAITKMGFIRLIVQNPATHTSGEREDVLTLTRVEFPDERDGHYKTSGILAPVQCREDSRRVGLPMLKNATRTQLQLELLRRTSKSGLNLDGQYVAADLEQNSHLWRLIKVSPACLENLFYQVKLAPSVTVAIAPARLPALEDELMILAQTWRATLRCGLEDREYIQVQWGCGDGNG